MPKASGKQRANWHSVVRRQQKSGLSVRQFCTDHQLSEPSFYYWKRQMTAHDGQTVRSSAQEPAEPESKQSEPNDALSVFIPMRLNTPASTVMEVVHPRGHVVRVPAVFDEKCLRQVLSVLDEQGEL